MNKAGKLAGEWGSGVLLTLGTLWVVQGALAFTPGHGVIVHGINYNAGAVKSGTVISHDVRVINLSAQSVKVDAQATCGCTIVVAPSRSLAPLHSGTVKAQIDTTGMHKGSQERYVILHFNSGTASWQKAVKVNLFLRS